jgi:transcription-repair coupling factor (superfamily II helicase)
MALSGLRQLSIIATPPPGRQDIIQKVSRLHDETLTEAIERELARKGQVYVVSPKVRQLHAIKEHIQALVPTARLAIAHGQLEDDALSKVIHAFDAREIDVLVASSIIENGLDLPAANTMIVMNAPHFGLSDLYQLRGRIGRREKQGYAYFFYTQSELTDIQRQRLAAITEASRQGSGWLIAQRDLEMRGAGNLLGAEQHGAGDAIGVQLYLDMVHQALGEQELEPNNVDIQLPISALLPAHYIADVQERSRWYQRLSRSQNEATLKDQKDKLEKNYGQLPEEAQNLILLLQLQIVAAKNGITKITTTTITPSDEEPYHRLEIEAQNLPQLLGKLSQLGNWQVKGQKAIWPTHKITKEIVEKLLEILELSS